MAKKLSDRDYWENEIKEGRAWREGDKIWTKESYAMFIYVNEHIDEVNASLRAINEREQAYAAAHGGFVPPTQK